MNPSVLNALVDIIVDRFVTLNNVKVCYLMYCINTIVCLARISLGRDKINGENNTLQRHIVIKKEENNV